MIPMKLYFNGCSHTYGTDLLNPDADSWPTIIANYYKCDFLNDSITGNANDHILYRTIKNIDEFDSFYIAWTHTARFTRYRSDNNHAVSFTPMLAHGLYGNDLDFQKYGKLHYAVWYNELYSFKLWLQQIILLQNLFKTKNKQYVMINTSNNLIDKWSVD